MNSGTLYRRSAFTDTPEGGNPAGVWVGEILPSVDNMQRIAAEVGYSETAFVVPTSGQNRTIRYYSHYGRDLTRWNQTQKPFGFRKGFCVFNSVKKLFRCLYES